MNRFDVQTADDVSDLPQSLFAGADAHATSHYFTLMSQDARFDTKLLVARRRHGGEAVGVMPVASPVQPTWHHPGYDPGRWGLPLVSRDPRDYLLVAGTSDYRQALRTCLRRPEESHEVAGSLLCAALELGVAGARTPLLQYVERDSPLGAAMTAHVSLRIVGDVNRYVIPSSGRDLNEYLAVLDRRKRSVIRRDLRDLTARDFRTMTSTWSELPDWTSDAISRVRARHVATHPRLVAYRLGQLRTDPQVEQVAFTTTSSTGSRAVSLGWIYDGALELYEIGMPAGGEDELLAYLEVMFYAPLRLLWSRGGGSLDLALEAPRPKMLRGAQPVPLVAGLVENAIA